jgi:hypothetical protein
MNFRLWYIFGALLGGAPLAQGTVYLLMNRKYANFLSALLVTVILVTSILVFLSPLHPERMDGMRMSGTILVWTFIRYITPFINIYGMIFLVGGAIFSALKYYRLMFAQTRVNLADSLSPTPGVNLHDEYRARFYGNLYIAIGGLLPGIGGSFTKFGYVEVLYVTEFVGIICIYAGYRIIRNQQARHYIASKGN